ncbi:MAG TPA: hypothetical protein VFU43_07280 [Streptosporangiaceae bacterium]|nr:hypothetical protein [Streptosporangiaceae bacterium]
MNVRSSSARATVLLLSLFVLMACGGPSVDSGTFVPPKAGERGLPKQIAKTQRSSRSAPMGHVAYQTPILPIKFSIDSDFNIAVTYEGRIVTPLGTFELSGGAVKDRQNQALRAEPADVTQMIICRDVRTDGDCQGYRIDTGRKLHIVMDGRFVQDIERNRIILRAKAGSTITVTDNGPPRKVVPHGPARIDIEEFEFTSTSEPIEVDLERRQGGTTPDLSYSHLTGELAPINGTRIAGIKKYREKKGRWLRAPGIQLQDKLPGEYECLKIQRDAWQHRFGPKDLVADTVIACVKTAEGDLGYLVIGRDRAQKPVAYYVYSYTWVR